MTTEGECNWAADDWNKRRDEFDEKTLKTKEVIVMLYELA